MNAIKYLLIFFFLTTYSFAQVINNETTTSEQTLEENDTILNLCKREEIPNDPAMRVSFCSKLDSAVSKILDKQMVVQQFYECRLASLERYMAFCVMFHAMASSSNHPVLNRHWDIARSQSNLRVATTASPIGASSGDESVTVSKKTKELVRFFGRKLSKIRLNF